MEYYPLVYVVVLNFNGEFVLHKCIKSFINNDYPNFRILIVDNASTDNSLQVIKGKHPEIETIQARKNRGWAAGNNLGLRYAIAQNAGYIFLANNDIVVDERSIRGAVRIAEEDHSIGVIGFNVIESGNSEENIRLFLQAKEEWEKLKYKNIIYVGGMAMLLRTSIIQHTGYFDENFFAYGDEIDYEIRVRKAGFKIVESNIPIWHYGQASFGKMKFKASLLQTRNNIQLLLKHGNFKQITQKAIKHLWKRIILHRREIIKKSPVEQRLYSHGRYSALLISILSIAWNIFHLPIILKNRISHNQLIDHNMIHERNTFHEESIKPYND